MDKVTRNDKRERIADYFKAPEDFRGCFEDDDINLAILADYAPLTPERRAELEERRRVIARLFGRATDAVEDNPNIAEYVDERRFFEAWLAEISAELEGG